MRRSIMSPVPFLRLFCMLLLLMVLPAGVRAQTCDFSVATFQSAGVNGSVSSFAVFDEGDGRGPALIVGGNYNRAGGLHIANIARWRPSTGFEPMGTSTQPMGKFAVLNGELYALRMSRLVKWNGDQWQLFPVPSGFWIHNLAVFNDGSGEKLYGLQHQFNGGLYCFDGANWNEVASLNGWALAMAAFDDGAGSHLYIGGSFTEIGGVSAKRLARWDGQTWSEVGGGVQGGSGVSGLFAYEYDGQPALYVGGSFRVAGELSSPYAAIWRGDDLGWIALPEPPVERITAVGQFGVWNDGSGHGEEIYAVAGDYEPYSGDSHSHLLCLREGSWTGLGRSFYLPSSCMAALQAFDDGEGGTSLFIGGLMSQLYPSQSVGGPAITIGGMARLTRTGMTGPRSNKTGKHFRPMPTPSEALTGFTYDLHVFDDGNGPAMYAAGYFLGIGDPPINSMVAKFDGQAWQPIAPMTATWSIPSARALTVWDNSLIVGGAFTAIGNVNAQRIARWNSATGTWSPLTSGVTNGFIHTLCVHDDGTGPALYAGGDFTVIGGVSSNRIARFDGVAWHPLQAGVGDGSVSSLVSFDDGTGPALYVGGYFGTVNGQPMERIARWRGAAGGWSPVGGGFPNINHRPALHVLDDGTGSTRLIAGGRFSHLGGHPQVPLVLAWDAPSHAWQPLGNIHSAGSYFNIGAFATFDDGAGPALYAFCRASSVAIARWKDNQWTAISNSLDSYYATGPGATAVVGSALYFGGPMIGRWSETGAELAITHQPQGGTFPPNAYTTLTLGVQQAGAMTYQWYRNGVPISNAASVTGATAPQLVFHGIMGKHEGAYHVVLSNGCDTLTSETALVHVAGTCFGDVTLDNQVGVDDLLAVITGWGACAMPVNCPPDLDPFGGDGAVDVNDLLALLNAWGACP